MNSQSTRTRANSKINYIYILSLAIIAIGLLIFFLIVHPLIIFDSDDWIFIAHTRDAIPLWEEWNPTRILPEVIMPFLSSLSVYTIMPITNDYIGSIAIMFGLALCIFAFIYIFTFEKAATKLFSLDKYSEIAIVLLTALFQFWIYTHCSSNNMHMFYEGNVTCTFFYIIPALLNSILVLYLLVCSDSIQQTIINKPLYGGLLILCIYLAINSNMFQSIILISFVSTKILQNFIFFIKKKQKFLQFLKNNALWFFTIICWFVSLFYEANGGRADSVTSDNFISNIQTSILVLITFVRVHMNRLFLVIAIICFIAGICTFFLRKSKDKTDYAYIKLVLFSLCCFAITSVYLILLCAKSSPYYFERNGVIFGISFYGMIIVIMSLSYILNRCPKLLLTVPLLLLIIVNQTVSSSSSYAPANAVGYNETICRQIDNDIISQVKHADKKGKTETTLYIPKFDSADNWPIAKYSGDYIADALCKHGITTKWIRITVKPTSKKNK